METLILTGWGWSDYACAAALALRHFGKADIRGVSTRRLPELLNEISGYKTILILGVGLTGNPELLQKGVEKLRAKGCNIRWISALPFPENLPDPLRILLNPFIDEDGVTAAVSNCFGIPYDDLLPLVREENATSEITVRRKKGGNFGDHETLWPQADTPRSETVWEEIANVFQNSNGGDCAAPAAEKESRAVLRIPEKKPCRS